MTIKQKQHLLAYLGYYLGEIDGKWGKLSREATEGFQKEHGLAVDGIFGPKTEEEVRRVIGSGEETGTAQWWGDIRHFRREDFRCKCGGQYCGGFPAEMEEKVVRIADGAVDHFGAEFDPALDMISGLRCPTHNANQGGVALSRHMTGKAIDLRIRGITAETLLEFIRGQDIRYAYAINGTNVHLDVE